jgi:DNA-binding NtrC family response regulator
MTQQPSASRAGATIDASSIRAPLGPVALEVRVRERPPAMATLTPGTALVVGRAASADVVVEDPAVSSLHARFVHDGLSVVVTDLGSRNGLRVGAMRVREATLGPGEVVQLGHASVALLEERDARCTLGEPLPGLVGTSHAMRRLAADVRRAAPLRLPTLIRGETGTGKDLVARAVHAASPRGDGPFVALNAAAIGRELAESELFGHERGAFTGALRERRGAFREAHRGTLFIDEIAALSLEVQAKLLRVVEDGVVRPLGGESRRAVDVRLIAATCEPLEEMVAVRAFRPDLFERLAACVVVVPPLRDRREDVAPLAAHLLGESGLGGARLAPSALALLRREPWPGNVRELRNVLVGAVLRSAGDVVEASHVAEAIAARAGVRARPSAVEARRIVEATGGNVSEAARRAAIPRSTLRDLLRVRTSPAS